MNIYQPIIGLEVHVELKTKSKMFCSCSTDYFGQSANTRTCPVCLGLPGALPVANKQAIDWCIMIAQALNCTINQYSKFDRKNYFYPDLPKGFQISQFDLPFGEHGCMKLKNGKEIGITRVHMEEDTAKLVHDLRDQNNAKGSSLIDFNRSSVPLVEIVTEPDFHSAAEVVEYLQRLQTIVRYLGVSDADMEKGNMRLEPNISLKAVRQSTAEGESQDKGGLPPYKVEVKNINSFKFVQKSIEYEITRQTEILESGKTPAQETRGWNEVKNATVSQRIKEEANDYRYFPEPDLPPVRVSNEQLSTIKSSVPELQEMKIQRFLRDFSLTHYDAQILTRDKFLAAYFEEAVSVGHQYDISPKQIANIMINKKVDYTHLLPAELIKNIKETSIIELPDENHLRALIEKVLLENAKAVTDYKNGKETVMMFLVGQVIRSLGKKADAQMIKQKLQSALK